MRKGKSIKKRPANPKGEPEVLRDLKTVPPTISAQREFTAIEVAQIAAILMNQSPGIESSIAVSLALELLNTAAVQLREKLAPKNLEHVPFDDAIYKITGVKGGKLGRAREYFRNFVRQFPREFPDLTPPEMRVIPAESEQEVGEGACDSVTVELSLSRFASIQESDIDDYMKRRNAVGFTADEMNYLREAYSKCRPIHSKNNN